MRKVRPVGHSALSEVPVFRKGVSYQTHRFVLARYEPCHDGDIETGKRKDTMRPRQYRNRGVSLIGCSVVAGGGLGTALIAVSAPPGTASNITDVITAHQPDLVGYQLEMLGLVIVLGGVSGSAIGLGVGLVAWAVSMLAARSPRKNAGRTAGAILTCLASALAFVTCLSLIGGIYDTGPGVAAAFLTAGATAALSYLIQTEPAAKH